MWRNAVSGLGAAIATQQLCLPTLDEASQASEVTKEVPSGLHPDGWPSITAGGGGGGRLLMLQRVVPCLCTHFQP